MSFEDAMGGGVASSLPLLRLSLLLVLCFLVLRVAVHEAVLLLLTAEVVMAVNETGYGSSMNARRKRLTQH